MKDVKVKITNKERLKDFLHTFGTDTIIVKSPIPERVILPNGDEELAFFLDFDYISEEQREKLILHISQKFDQKESFVRYNLEKIGLPILKKDTILIIENPQRWF